MTDGAGAILPGASQTPPRRADATTGTPADTTVAASLASAKVVRTATGRRQVRLVLTPEEALTLRVRIRLTDAAGNTETLHRSVHVPRKRP